MTDDSKDKSTGQRRNAKSTHISSTQGEPPSAPGSRAPTPEDAAADYGRISALIGITGVHAPFLPSDPRCENLAGWCLPDVSCTARLTLGAQALEALEKIRKLCDPGRIE